MRLEEALREYNAAYPANAATLSRPEGALVIAPSGSFDLASSQGLLDLLSRIVDAAEPGSSFTVNLSKASYLPSTAIGALSTAMVKARGKDMEFRLRDVPEPIAKIIKLLGFWEYFNAG